MPAISMYSESSSIPCSNGAVSSAPSTSEENSLKKFSIFSAVRATSPCKEVTVSSIVNCLKDETGQVEMPKLTVYENAHEEADESMAIETLLLLSSSNNNIDAGKGMTIVF